MRLLPVFHLAVLVLASACRPGDKDRSPYASEVAEAIPRIEAATGLKFKRPPKVEVRSKEQVKEFLLRKLDAEEPAHELAGEEAAYKLFGLLPDTMQLRPFLIRLLTEQVIGYYDPAAKTLYVVQGADEASVGVTITHELVHALQDQYVNLDSIQKLTGDADRATAAQTVIEGDATFEQIATMVGGPANVAMRIGGRERMREMIRENGSKMPLFNTAPMVLQEELLFPYLTGADFMMRYREKKGTANPLADMPTSTEQLLHTDSYFGAKRDEPSDVTLPAPRGATAFYSNDMGEFGTRLFLYQQLNDPELSARAAAGWDGDRYVVLQSGSARGIVWASVWDSPLEAAEFSDALVRATAHRTGEGERQVAGGGATFVGRGRTVSILPRTVGDRAMVIYIDLPDAIGAGVIDVNAIRVTAR